MNKYVAIFLGVALAGTFWYIHADAIFGMGDDGHANMRYVDLSHAYDDDTIYWPTSPTGYTHEELAYGMTEAGYFYSAYTFSMPEHGGTHMDAPSHFNAEGWTLDKLPLERLIGQAFVIDVSAKVEQAPDYLLSVADVEAFEAAHGTIPEGAIVLMRTDWSEKWPDALAYLGDDTPGEASNLHFPGFGVEAGRLLVEERGVAMLGIDTASVDYGPSQDFQVHRIGAARNVANLENLTGLAALPPVGAMLIALPVKLGGGSGGPVRVVGVVTGE